MLPSKNDHEWRPYFGPVRVVGWAGEPPTCITVGNRVRAWWQRYGYVIGTATVIGFEISDQGPWIRVVVRCDRPDGLQRPVEGEDPHISRWDWDRTELEDGHWEGETQEESVGRWLTLLEREKATHAA